MNALIRVLITAVALAVATALVPGIEVQGDTTLSKVLTLIVVALIFGIVNTFLKPIIKAIGCAADDLTGTLPALFFDHAVHGESA